MLFLFTVAVGFAAMGPWGIPVAMALYGIAWVTFWNIGGKSNV